MNADAQRAMNNIERQGNPWGLNRKEKENWRELDPTVQIPTVKEAKNLVKDSSIYSGSARWGHLIAVHKKSLYHLLRLMNEAGVKFAILGNKEKNSGDTPRRLGNEFLFQELATKH